MTAAGNNNFADAYVITALPYTSTGESNVDNDREVGETQAGFNQQRTAWWKWVADATQNVTVDSHQTTEVGGDFPDTVLGVWVGASLTGLGLVVFNDDYNSSHDIYTSQVTFLANAGTTYYFQLGQYGYGLPSYDIFVLHVVGATAPPPNPTIEFIDPTVRRRPL